MVWWRPLVHTSIACVLLLLSAACLELPRTFLGGGGCIVLLACTISLVSGLTLVSIAVSVLALVIIPLYSLRLLNIRCFNFVKLIYLDVFYCVDLFKSMY
jgi:hypothetical protein